MNKIWILLGFVETEKVVKSLQPQSKYVFKVRPDATKLDIKYAVKSLYGVNVKSVNVIKSRQKTRSVWRWRLIVKRKNFVKAVVTLKEWEKIDFSNIQDQKIIKDGK